MAHQLFGVRGGKMRGIVFVVLLFLFSVACQASGGNFSLAPTHDADGVELSHMTPPTSLPAPSPTPFPACTVTVDEALNMRVGPGTNYKVIAWLKPGQILAVYGRSNDWLFVGAADGKTGYIHHLYCGE